MKKSDHYIASKIKQTILVFGILVGFTAMTLQDQWLFQVAAILEEHAEEDSPTKSQVKAIDAITYSSQINVNHQSILIEELPEDEVEKEENLETNPVVAYCSKALKILFRSIISPNAP